MQEQEEKGILRWCVCVCVAKEKSYARERDLRELSRAERSYFT